MNYFGHAALASEHSSCPRFVFGSMLPDFQAMAGARSAPPLDTAVAAGLRFHVRTDSVFHQTQAFIDLNYGAASRLRELGVRRGPARAAAHVGVEMLIDARLLEVTSALEHYEKALQLASRDRRLLAGFSRFDTWRIRSLTHHLASKGRAVHETSAERFHFRLGGTLRGRRRLEPSAAELECIAQFCMDFAPEVNACLGGLLVELRSGLLTEPREVVSCDACVPPCNRVAAPLRPSAVDSVPANE